jgi:hypothetical protein
MANVESTELITNAKPINEGEDEEDVSCSTCQISRYVINHP